MERVLLIWENGESAFFSKTIKEQLAAKHIDSVVVRPDVDEISRVIEKTGLIILDVYEDVMDAKNLQIYLRDHCIEHEKKICFVGYEDDIKEVSQILNGSYVERKYKRPIDVKNVVAGIEEYLQEKEEGTPKKFILIVDDDPVMLRAEKGWFEAKYTVSMANSAAMAFSYLAKNKPDLILLDYDMPLCTGAKFLEMMKAEEMSRDIPVIFVTGKSDKEIVKEVVSLKPAGYLLKSMEPEKIVEYVDIFFEKQKQAIKEKQL